jgi:hypothetical protein
MDTGCWQVDFVLTFACTQRVKHLMREYKHMVQDPQMLKPLLARLTQHQVSLNPKPQNTPLKPLFARLTQDQGRNGILESFVEILNPAETLHIRGTNG